MSNGTSLSFLVYMIYNKSIWKYKGEESGYMEKAMEKIKNMKNGTASEKHTGSEGADIRIWQWYL